MSDEMLKHLPPGPYSFRTTAKKGGHDGKGNVHVQDANGKNVAAIWGSPDEKLAMATLMIEARDRVTERGWK
jgi:hypothetical protein